VRPLRSRETSLPLSVLVLDAFSLSSLFLTVEFSPSPLSPSLARLLPILISLSPLFCTSPLFVPSSPLLNGLSGSVDNEHICSRGSSLLPRRLTALLTTSSNTPILIDLCTRVGLGESGLCPFEGLIARRKLVKWVFVVIDFGLGVADPGTSVGLFSEDCTGEVAGAGHAGRRACAAFAMDVRSMAGWESPKDSAFSLSVITEKPVEVEEVVLMLF